MVEALGDLTSTLLAEQREPQQHFRNFESRHYRLGIPSGEPHPSSSRDSAPPATVVLLSDIYKTLAYCKVIAQDNNGWLRKQDELQEKIYYTLFNDSECRILSETPNYNRLI